MLAYGPYNGRDRRWIFTVQRAVFYLIPRRTQGDEAAFTEPMLAFANQPDPDRTHERTLQRLVTVGLQSLQSEALMATNMPSSSVIFNPHNTRFRTPLQAAVDDVIRFTKLRPLGRGGQGDVHRVVDMHNGKHYTCKTVAVKAEIPQWRIYSDMDFRARVEMEVNLVQAPKHVSTPVCMAAFIMLTITSGPYRALHPYPGIQNWPEHRNLHAPLRRQPLPIHGATRT